MMGACNPGGRSRTPRNTPIPARTAKTASVPASSPGLIGVKCATTGNVSLTGAAGTQDGFSTSNGMKILVWQQTDTTMNGVYVINTAGAWQKLYAFDSSVSAITGDNVGMVIAIANGTLYGKTFFQWDGGTTFVKMGGYYI
jgi:hypothetical protein